MPSAHRARRVRLDVLDNHLRAHHYLHPLRRRELSLLPPPPWPVRPPLELLPCVIPSFVYFSCECDADGTWYNACRRGAEAASVGMVVSSVSGVLGLDMIPERTGMVCIFAKGLSRQQTIMFSCRNLVLSACTHCQLLLYTYDVLFPRQSKYVAHLDALASLRHPDALPGIWVGVPGVQVKTFPQ